jgi:3-hydroxyisobutyrate dehydrogenase-like beta-hydroxyacid dehydrogenase
MTDDIRFVNDIRSSRDIAFIGFGEAASTFVAGWGTGRKRSIKAYDIKTDHGAAAVREGKLEDYTRAGIEGCRTLREAISDASVIFSTVTADQALVAAGNAGPYIPPGTLYLDCNSCAPDTKRKAYKVITDAGGRYVDAAIMAPVQPELEKTPLLLSGPSAPESLEVFRVLGMNAKIVQGEVGSSSSIKMIRSIMIKGLESLVTECVLAGRRADVDAQVLDSLEHTFPGFDWKKRTAYMLERTMIHGIRRSAEMREVALTVQQLDLDADMSLATVKWQQRIGELKLQAKNDDYRQLADDILTKLNSLELE